MCILKIKNLTVTFGGIRALDEIDFQMKRGQIYSLIGPNGAGKTTLLNCISRIYEPRKGLIEFEDKNLLNVAPHKVAEMGISRTFQNIELFSNITVMDNMLLGRHRLKRSNILTEMLFLPSVRAQEVVSRQRVEEIIDFLDLQPFREMKVRELPYGIRKLVELGRALALKPKLLLLDEPASGMIPEEKEDLIFTIKDIRAYLKISVLIVEHDIRLVMGISDRVCVLNHGRVLAEGLPKEIQEDKKVIDAHIGMENDNST